MSNKLGKITALIFSVIVVSAGIAPSLVPFQYRFLTLVALLVLSAFALFVLLKDAVLLIVSNRVLLSTILLFAATQIVAEFIYRVSSLNYSDPFSANIRFVLSFIITVVAHSFFYGLISNIILNQVLWDEKTNVLHFLRKLKAWFPKSILALTIAWVGTIFISLVLLHFVPDVAQKPMAIFLGGVWTTLTFLLFPVIFLEAISKIV